MKITHRIFFNPKMDKAATKKFQKLGIEMKKTGSDYSFCYYFDMYEDNPLWPEVERVLLSAGIHTSPDTEFTEEEIMSAEWVLIYPSHFAGYPMPDLDDSWRNISFNAGQQCQICGIGRKQVSSIHLKTEPKLGRNHFMGIFWTYDIFARNEIFDILSQNSITGFEAYPAIHYKKKVPLTTIKQLKVSKELAPGVIADNLTHADVEGITADNIITHENYPCGHIKYLGLGCGMYKFSRNIFKNVPDLVKTHEWFGGGYSATQFILASVKFVKVYMENNWKGLSLSPIELIRGNCNSHFEFKRRKFPLKMLANRSGNV